MKLALKRAETTVNLCLDGAKYAEHKTASEELERLKRERLNDDRLNSGIKTLAEKIISIETDMQKDTVQFTLRALARSDWDRLTTAHPAKEGNKADQAYGFNATSVAEEGIPLSIVGATKNGKKVDFDPTTDWSGLADEMSDTQYEDFVLALFSLNRGRQDLPFSFSASQEIRNSDEK